MGYYNERPWYDTAQVCLNGHVITSGIRTSPEEAAKYCSQCGAETITQCPQCHTDIRGYYHVPGVVGGFRYVPPAFCHQCGKPYPWTESRLKAAEELIDLAEHVSVEEKRSLKNDLLALTCDTPRTNVAVAKMAEFLRKAGKEVGSAMRDILTNIASEAVRKALFPGS
jgi:hypothetical protein